MSVRIVKTHPGVVPGDAELDLIRRGVSQWGRCTLLAPSLAERDQVRRSLARAGVGVCIDATVVPAWIESLWELLGDGSHLCSGVQRQLVMAELVRTSAPEDLAPLRANPGTVRLLAAMARDLLPYAGASAASGASDGAAASVLACLRRYADALADRGLTEPSCAAATLAEALAASPVACARFVVLRGITTLPAYLMRLLASVAAAGEAVVLLAGEQAAWSDELAAAFANLGCDVAIEECIDGHPTAPCATPTFLEVFGPHARSRAYADAIARAGADGARSAAVASAHASELADALAPYLAARGIPFELTRFVRFGQTAFGRQLRALSDLVARMRADEEQTGSALEWWPAPELTDWLYSPLSGADALLARSFDKKVRATRSLGVQGVLRELQSVQSRTAAARRKLADGHPFARVPAVCADVVRFLWQDRPVSAIKAMLEVLEVLPAASLGSVAGTCRVTCERAMARRALEVVADEARALGVSQASAVESLDGLCVVSRERASASPAVENPAIEVSFMTLADAAALPGGSVDFMLVADVDVASYPLSHDEGARASLADLLGAPTLSLEPIARVRDLMGRARAAARSCTLARVTHDRQAKDRYPAAIWTELLAALGEGASIVREGEQDVAGDFDPVGAGSWATERIACLPPQQLDEAAARYMVLMRRTDKGALEPRQFSASQIEMYSSCPLCWFMSSRVRPAVIDAGFTNMEKGNFVHDVMDRFHERLVSGGARRVTPENLASSLDLLDEVFAEVRAEHARGKTASSAPLVALGAGEERQIDDILPQLRKVVRYEAGALAPFAPAYLEYSFNGLGVTYAGYPLGGRIDRVDVDAAGRAVVIDYKHRSDVTPFKLADPTVPNKKTGEVVADDPRWLPEHTQTLIYAQALRRSLGLDVRGALYFATKGKVAMRGAVADELAEVEPDDGRVPGLRDGFPGERAGGTMGFTELLDRVEGSIAMRLADLASGKVAASAEQRPSCVHNHPIGFERRDA